MSIIRIDKTFTPFLLEEIKEYSFKKLNVADMGKLRDRYEGEIFYNNTINKVFTLSTILEYLGYNKKLKIGFVNTIEIKSITKLSFNYINDIQLNEPDKHLTASNKIYSFIDQKQRKCSILIESNNIEELNNSIKHYLNKFNHKKEIYV
jgi:hypothetical protein